MNVSEQNVWQLFAYNLMHNALTTALAHKVVYAQNPLNTLSIDGEVVNLLRTC